MALIELILPPWVSAAEMDPALAPDTVYPEEELLVERAVAARRRQFRAARACAHAALEGLGVARAPILRGEHGEPLWPADVVGSIAHCRRHAAVAVARRADAAALGIDVEPNERLREGLLKRIALPAERDMVEGVLRDRAPVCFDRLLFCGKEAAYKAWFSLTGRSLGLHDVEISLGAAPQARKGAWLGSVRARVVAGEDGPHHRSGPREMGGRWMEADGILALALWQAQTGGR
ncbi:MAG: 4'-phosphopantetheinyl transferase family protein [Solirubrobacteraceae bacterium]